MRRNGHALENRRMGEIARSIVSTANLITRGRGMSAGNTRVLHERIRIGFMPCSIAAVPVIAARAGFARRQGLEIELWRETSWANVARPTGHRHFDAAHLLAPTAHRGGFRPHPYDVPLARPMVLASGGNAITVSRKVLGGDEGRRGRRVVANDRFPPAKRSRAPSRHGRRAVKPPLAFVVFTLSSHNYELRHWLAAAWDRSRTRCRHRHPAPALYGRRTGGGPHRRLLRRRPVEQPRGKAGPCAVILTKPAIWPRAPTRCLRCAQIGRRQTARLLHKLLTAMLEKPRAGARTLQIARSSSPS